MNCGGHRPSETYARGYGRRCRLMRPQANFTRQLAVIAVFAASCVMILVYLWGAFGGNIPLKPKNYQVSADFPDASNLALNADVRISGVNVGHVIAKSSAANS